MTAHVRRYIQWSGDGKGVLDQRDRTKSGWSTLIEALARKGVKLTIRETLDGTRSGLIGSPDFAVWTICYDYEGPPRAVRESFRNIFLRRRGVNEIEMESWFTRDDVGLTRSDEPFEGEDVPAYVPEEGT